MPICREGGGEHGRRNQGDCQDGPEEENPAVSRPPGRGAHLFCVATGTGRCLPRGEGAQGETAQGKGRLTMGEKKGANRDTTNGAIPGA